MFSDTAQTTALLFLCLVSIYPAASSHDLYNITRFDGIQDIRFSFGVPPAAVTSSEDTFLSGWMGQIGHAISNLTLLDISLPGTHDTMTYDLSSVISDGGIDDYPELAAILNDFGDVLPTGWIITQAQTQALTVTDQLNAGIRFLDFRIMYTSGDWYCLHMVQTNQKAITYLQEVRDWVTAHPTELLVIWMSKHGSECKNGDAQYPGVTPAQKQSFWGQINDLFKGVIFDESTNALNLTSVGELVASNNRVIFFASDFLEFTGGNTSLALDACRVHNSLDISELSSMDLDADLQVFNRTEDTLAADKAAGKFFLLSMASSPPSSTIELNAEIHFLAGGTSHIAECAAEYNVPNMTEFCPETLLDYEQLSDYYHQITLDAAYEAGYSFPNAIYLDVVTSEGLIRTGTRSLAKSSDTPPCDIFEWTSCQTHQPACDAGWTGNGEKAHWNVYASDGKENTFCGLAWQNHYKCCRDVDAEHASDGFAYVDTLVAYNIRKGCKQGITQDAQCLSLSALIAKRRAAHVKQLWDDQLTGRRSGITAR